MRFLYPLFLLIISTSYEIYAQGGYKEGYIILKGDTLAGFVFLRDGGSANKFCDFKSNIELDQKRYTPEELDGYGYKDNRSYVSAKVEDQSKLVGKYFIQLYISGALSLYRLEDQYVISKEKRFFLLKNSAETTVVNEEEYIKNKKEYLGLLSYLTSDCSSQKVGIPINKVDYSLDNIGKYITTYNKCVGKQTKNILEKKKATKLSMGVSVLANFHKMSIDPYNPYYQTFKGSFKSDVSLGLGLPLHFYFQRFSDRFSFYLEPQYFKSAYLIYNSQDFGYYKRNHFLNIDFSTLKLPLGLKYCFSRRAINPNFGFGPSFNFISNTKQSLREEVVTNNSVVTIKKEPLSLFKVNNGIWLSIGAESYIRKNFVAFIEFRVELNNGIFDIKTNEGPYSNSLNHQITLGVKTR